MEKIDINKKYQTRDGKEVHLISVNLRGSLPVGGYIGDNMYLSHWSKEGVSSDGYNLIEMPEERKLKGFMNIYTDNSIEIFHNEAHAQVMALTEGIFARIDLSTITVKKGQGL